MIGKIKTLFKKYGSNYSVNAGDVVTKVSIMIGITMVSYDDIRKEFYFVVNRAYPVFKTKSFEKALKLMNDLKKGSLPFYGYAHSDKITFGVKHKGKYVAQLPTSYLNWMYEKDIQKSLVSGELNRRKRRVGGVDLQNKYDLSF